MKKEISDLVDISRYYGSNKDFVVSGGGNTSFKDENTVWIKASGQSLSELTGEGLVALDRKKLQQIAEKDYPEDPVIREEHVKNDLMASITDSDSNKRPSVETSLHEIINYRFVVHLHPAAINGVLCSWQAKTIIHELFGDKAIFVPYTDPGYTLFKSLKSEIARYREKHISDPKMIFLENHGSFVSADTTEEIRDIYNNVMSAVMKKVRPLPETEALPYNPVLGKALPVIRMLLSKEKAKVVRFRHNSLIAKFYRNQQEYHRISLPLTPDIIVYCKSRYLFIEQSSTAEKIVESFRHQLPRFLNEYGYLPKVILIKDHGLLAVEQSVSAAESVLDVYEDLLRISHYSSSCGGPKFMSPEQSSFIDKWEVENYRRKVGLKAGEENRLAGKVAVVTGGARGFGAGIAEELFRKAVNVVVADLNEEEGVNLVNKLNSGKSTALAAYVKTDVSDHQSVRNMIEETVSRFGGLDIMISNAGILKAGGLDEIDPEIFATTTGINYSGYFHCAKYAAEIMKIQNNEKPGYYTDIIQINSKSGLRGSNRNFAYAGSKFGGIGLTQSFALELAPYRIKVNSICPGNFYEGPLWSDPHNGLFVQYLRTGKVPGAKTIEDVRRYYEDQVPMKRGCRLEDVMKALLYIIDQEYETGQAVPVTGGQIMLG